jgi:U3 small nucleolar ribonucleoprotein component
MAAGTVWNGVKESNKPGARELAIREANNCPSGRLAMMDAQTLAQIETTLVPSIGIVEDTTRGCSGPLLVRGGIRIESEDGTPYKTRNRAALCRCGASSNKPFCNGSHRRIKFKDGLMNF